MKALKSSSVQTLIIGCILCTVMAKITDDITIPTIFAGAFTAIVAGRKTRDVVQSSKGQYYDGDKLKNAE